MAPQKTVVAQPWDSKALLKGAIAKYKEDSKRLIQMMLSETTIRKTATLWGWAKGSRQAALAGKRFNCKTDPFTLLVMKILKEQNPTTFRSIRVQKEAIRALQESAEDHVISVLAGVAVVAEHADRKAPITKDFETLKNLEPYVK